MVYDVRVSSVARLCAFLEITYTSGNYSERVCVWNGKEENIFEMSGTGEKKKVERNVAEKLLPCSLAYNSKHSAI